MTNAELIEKKQIYNGPTAKDKERARIFMMYLAMFAIFIMFGGFCSYFIVRQGQSDWLRFDVPGQFTQSTVVILISSITMVLGSVFTRKGNRWLSTLFIFSTLILGIIFTYLQWEGWTTLIERDLHPADPRTSAGNNSVSLFYAITGLHVAHVLGGLIALFVTSIRAAANKYKPQSYTGVKLTALYWHFLGGLWLYLFLFWNYADQIF
jgi:cytochrome c oxidase subunit 3